MGNYDKYTTNQRDAILHNNGNMLVSASAGSGKTMVVIQRMLRLIIENGVSIDKILAVTFTNAAASEMKEKLKKEILICLSEKNDEFLKGQLDKVNTASISTIHSFCYDLIKKYFFELGLDASVKLIDEKESDKIAGEALEGLFDRFYEEGNLGFFDALSYFTQKRKDKKLRETVLKLYKFSDEESDLNGVYQKTKYAHENAYSLMLDKVFNATILELNELESMIDDVVNLYVEDQARKKYASELKQTVISLQSAKTPEELVSTYAILKKGLPRNKSVEPNVDEQLKTVKGIVDDLVENVEKSFSSDELGIIEKANNGLNVAKKLFWLTEEFKKEYEKLKAENNVVDFSDLQKYALKLLENQDILNAVKSKYEYVFVDEYQDVNDLQERLINLISNDNLFMVGDSKQSIYAFRGCNPKFFIKKYDKYLKNTGGEAISLDNNFRSSNAVITSVNKIFSDVFTPEFSGLSYADNKMVYGGLYNDYHGKVVYHLIDDKTPLEKQEPKGVYSVVENYKPVVVKEYLEEAGLVVKLITDIVGTKYYDIKASDGEDPMKEFCYKDICILSRSNSELVTNVLSALNDFQIPVTIGGKNSIDNYPEIKVLISLVSALCFINQDIHLATIMLNLWDFTEEELSIIREQCGKDQAFYDCVKAYSANQNELGVKISKFLSDIDRIRLVSEFTSANEILTRVVSETEWDAKLLALPLGEEKLKRVERFIAESIVGDSKMNIKEFNDYIVKSVEDVTITETTGDNTVKFMTEHSSKGLEFPCVIVIGNDTKFNAKDVNTSVILDREYGVVTKLYNPETMIVEDNPVASVVKAEYKIKRAVEEARVLYVALTRAKCELHVIAKSKNVSEFRKEFKYKRAGKASDYLSRQDAECIIYNGDDLTLSVKKQGVAVAGKIVNENLSKVVRENLTYRYPHVNETTIPLKTSVSDVNGHSEDEYFRTPSIFTGDSAERGTAYHKILEKCDFYAPDLSVEIDNVLANNFTSKEISLIDKNKVLDILSMDIFNEIKGYNLQKEKKFYCLIDGDMLGYESSEKVLVQGIIDLLCENDDGIILIDYKFSSIESEKDLIEKYSKQIQLYKRAIEIISGKKVIKSYLVNILKNKKVEL